MTTASRPLALCRSCQAYIIWAVSVTSGKRMPLDAEPSPRGNVEIVGGDEKTPTVRIVPARAGLYVSHFATCPAAAQHRKGKAKR